MSIVTILTKTTPSIAGLTFDAVLEDTYQGTVDYTGYTIENGAHVTDFGIVRPSTWRVTGIVSNNPISASVTDFAVGALSNLIEDAPASFVAGLSAGFLAGSNQTRASAALTTLITIMIAKTPFDVDAGDIQLSNMVMTQIRRDKNRANENGLVFQADLQELPTLDTIASLGQPKQGQLRNDDPAKNQAAAFIRKGEQQLKEAGDAVNNQVEAFLQ